MQRNSSHSIGQSPGAFIKTALADLRGSFGLTRLLFLANMRSRHRRAVIGYAWLIIPGIITAIAFTLLRKYNIFGTSETGLPYPLFVLSGMFLWQSFVDAMTLPVQQLIQQRHFLSVVPAPYEAVLLASAGDVLVNLAVRMTILWFAIAAFGLPVKPEWLLMPLAGLAMVIAGFTVALLAAPFAQLLDDVASIIGLIGTFGLFLLPILYVIPPESILALNPLVAAMDAARAWMAGEAAPESFAPLIIVAVVSLPLGWLLNSLARPHLAARAH
jgi:lipopolysaccharide transport system permease protein